MSLNPPFPFQVVMCSDCILSKRLPHDHSIGAKSVFDALIKEWREDDRIALQRWTSRSSGKLV